MCFGGGGGGGERVVYQPVYKEAYVEPTVDEQDPSVQAEVDKSKRLAASRAGQEGNDQTLGNLGTASVTTPTMYGY